MHLFEGAPRPRTLRSGLLLGRWPADNTGGTSIGKVGIDRARGELKAGALADTQPSSRRCGKRVCHRGSWVKVDGAAHIALRNVALEESLVLEAHGSAVDLWSGCAKGGGGGTIW
jgi:hypothetical protein